MSNYNFSTLNDKDFEKLARDLLNAKFKLDLQDFKSGRDKGVDLRNSTPKNNNSIVVQVKHLINSKFAQLKFKLVNEELNKIKKIRPDKYIVVTSLPLSNTEKDEIKALLKPFVLTSNDVIGQEDLNNYLNEFSDIEKKHFKLWFSSISILDSILNNAITGRSKYLLETIRKKIPFYVITKKLDEANRILNKEKLLLITGQPGIGKTTLAEIILFERAKNGYKIYSIEDIREAENVISPDDEEKQLFYFDDFLGANYVDIVTASKTETQITSFVERVRNTPNKYLVLTTRTIILNHAVKQFEKINRSNLAKEKFEIELTDYSKYEKALILYNHLFFNEVKEELYNSILHKRFYWNIIGHTNYTPRIIEFITNKSQINSFSASEYRQFIENNLNNPSEIWRHSFNNQIEYLDRCLLLTLFTFNYEVSEEILIKAFEARLQYEKETHNQIITSNQFSESIKLLLDGFVTSVLSDDERRYSFINPSLPDFLINYVSESFGERKSIISSVINFEQLKRFAPQISPIPLEKELQIIIRDKFANSEIGFTEDNRTIYQIPNKRHLATLKALCQYCSQINIDSVLLKTFKRINFEEDYWLDSDDFQYVLLNIMNSPQTFNFIKNNFNKIIESIMEGINTQDSAEKIPRIFNRYEQNFKTYQQTGKGVSKIKDLIYRIAEGLVEDFKNEKEDDIEDIDEVNDFYDELQDIEENLCKILLASPRDYYSNVYFDEDEWEEKIKENLSKKFADNDEESDKYNNHYQKIDSYDEDKSIDDLFSN